MSGLPVLSIIALTPVAGSVLIALFGRGQQVPRAIALLAGTICLASSAWVYATYDRAAGGMQFVERLPWIPSIGASYTLGVDGISVPMLALMGIVMFTGVLVSWDVTERPREFFALLLLLVTGVFGVFVATDAFLLFFFYEMAVVPMYLLIAIWGSTRKDYAAMKLTLFLFAGSAVLVVALALIYWQVGANTFDLRSLGAARLPADVPALGVPAHVRRLRRARADLAAAHLVARRPRRCAHRRVDDARGRAAQDRRLRRAARRHDALPRRTGRLGRS